MNKYLISYSYIDSHDYDRLKISNTIIESDSFTEKEVDDFQSYDYDLQAYPRIIAVTKLDSKING